MRYLASAKGMDTYLVSEDLKCTLPPFVAQGRGREWRKNVVSLSTLHLANQIHDLVTLTISALTRTNPSPPNLIF